MAAAQWDRIRLEHEPRGRKWCFKKKTKMKTTPHTFLPPRVLGEAPPERGEPRSHSEGVARADVLQLLGHLRGCPVQLLGHVLLLVGLHGVELLAQVPVDHVLGGQQGGK